MSRRARTLIVVGTVVVALVSLLVPERERPELESTTAGTMPWGRRAAYDLLAELGFAVARFRDPVERLPAGTTAWWIAPRSACGAADVPQDASWLPRTWIDGGGTAVVFVPHARPGETCRVGDLALPAHRQPDKACTDATVEGIGPTRNLGLSDLHRFDLADDWTTRATVAGRTFVIERALGAGRVVAVADPRILENGHLDVADTAPLVVDLARSFGAPTIVETAPPSRSPSLPIYLVRSPAAAPLAGLLATGLLVAWLGFLVPPRTIDDAGAPPPTLATFVDSLARLYAGTGDHGRVLERYRALTANRLRRVLRLAPDVPIAEVAARVDRLRGPDGEARQLLLGSVPVASTAALRAMAARLDALVAAVPS